MKPVSYKRILSYVLDIIIVTVISSLLTYFIPVSEKYQTKNEEFLEIVDKYSKGEITRDEYLEKGNDVSYDLNKETIATSIVTTVVTIIYFVVFAFYMNGQTLGKKLMKIKVVSSDDSKLTMNNFLLRGLIIDSILMNVITIALLLIMSKSLYLKSYDIISTIFSALYLVSFVMILFRNDGRGLHDFIARTKVVLINEEPISEILPEKEKKQKIAKKEKMVDAEIVEHKKK